MSVGELLGLDGDSELLDQACRRWEDWVATDDRLGVVERFDDLRGYLRGATTQEADRCLLALAMLAAPDGGDDLAAAAALAKALLPGASVLARRLSVRLGAQRTGESRDVDELVASQLWLEVRSFPWRRLTKVGGNILMNTQQAVLRDCGDYGQLRRSDPTWARTVCLDMTAGGGDGPDLLDRRRAATRLPAGEVGWGAPADADPEPSALQELREVLAWACENDVISDRDRMLLLCLVEEASDTQSRSTTRGRANLCANNLTAQVAPRLGLSPATVRRRAARSMRALAAAAPTGFAS